MVALLPALSMGLTSLVSIYLLYPRLPHYSFKIRSFGARWYSDLGFRAMLGAKVQLKNDNHMAIDIHALSFDLYYPDWSGNIQLLGNVQDARQRQVVVDDPDPAKNATLVNSWKESVSSMFSSSSTPLWHMEARKHFETYDSVLMAPMGGLSVMGNLGWDMVKQWGVIQVQSTGAVHIKSDSKMPLTLNIICDNLLDGWTLEMQGMHCELDQLDVGWKDIPNSLEALRAKLLRPRSALTQKIEDENLSTVGV